MPNMSQKHLTLIKALFASRKPVQSEWQRATDLIRAIDAGGLPLNPARVNDIARQLGLEVSMKSPVEETVDRIRKVLARQSV